MVRRVPRIVFIISLNIYSRIYGDHLSGMDTWSCFRFASPVSMLFVEYSHNIIVNSFVMTNNNRVIAYFDHQGRIIEVKGVILQSLSQRGSEQPKFYELHTDKMVDFQTRDLEVQLKAPRSTNQANSLFVSADQCAPDNTPPPLPPNHPNQKEIESQKPLGPPTQFKTGDPVTFPIEEAPNGLINGIVGYTGSYNMEKVTELCADQNTITSAFICKIRGKYEFPNFPDGKRLCNMRGFSLVVPTHQLIPGAHLDTSQKSDVINGSVINSKTSFSQAVSSSNSRKVSSSGGSSNYPSTLFIESILCIPPIYRPDYLYLAEYGRSVTIVTNPERGFLNHQKHTSIDKPRVLSHFSGRKMSQIFSGRVRLNSIAIYSSRAFGSNIHRLRIYSLVWMDFIDRREYKEALVYIV